MSIFDLAFKPVSASLSMGLKIATTQNHGMRAAGIGGAGALIGGVVGAASGYDTNSRIEGALKGATLGALGGGAIGAATHRSVKRAAFKGTTKAASFMWKDPGMRNIAKSGVKGIGKAAMFAVEHPIATATVVGGTAGAYALTGEALGGNQDLSSPTLEGASVNTNYDQQAIAASQMGQIGGGLTGTASQMQPNFQYANWMQTVGSLASRTPAAKMASSTFGLNMGLHSGRHG